MKFRVPSRICDGSPHSDFGKDTYRSSEKVIARASLRYKFKGEAYRSKNPFH